MVTEADLAERGDVEGSKTVPVADNPSERDLEAGLSGVLGGWSGGTFASTALSVADFSPLSRGSSASRDRSRASRTAPRRRSPPRPPATRPLRGVQRKPPGAKTAPLM